MDVEQISDHITFIDRGRIIDSDDKETYLDRWRRLRLDVPAGVVLPTIPGVVAKLTYALDAARHAAKKQLEELS